MAGKNAQEGFNRFVEGDGKRNAPLDETRKDFWDDFSNLAEQRKQNNSIGTSAMGMGKKGGAGAQTKSKDEWDDW